jgi:ferredoxin-like protein FixX
MSPILGSHHSTRTVAFDFAGCLACRTFHIVALVGDDTAFELNRGGLGNGIPFAVV